MGKGRHSSKHMGFTLPKGPTGPGAAPDDPLEVPEEIEKTAAGMMQTAPGEAPGTAPAEGAQAPALDGEAPDAPGDAADGAGSQDGETLDEWMARQEGHASEPDAEPGAPEEGGGDGGEGQDAPVAAPMKKGKLVVLLALVAAALVAVAVLVVTSLPADNPSKILDTALMAAKQQDASTVEDVYAGTPDDIRQKVREALCASIGVDGYETLLGDLNDQQKAVLEQLDAPLVDFDYSLGSETVDGDSAQVVVTVRAHDFGTLFEKVLGDFTASSAKSAFNGTAISDRDSAALLCSTLEKYLGGLGDKTREATTTFALVKTDGGWRVQELSEDNLDALTGGGYGFLSTMGVQGKAPTGASGTSDAGAATGSASSSSSK